MDGFPTKDDHFCGSFGTLILSHKHTLLYTPYLSNPLQRYFSLDLGEFDHDLATEPWESSFFKGNHPLLWP